MISVYRIPSAMRSLEEFESWLENQKLSLATFQETPAGWVDWLQGLTHGFIARTSINQLVQLRNDESFVLDFTVPLPEGIIVLVRKLDKALAA